MVIGDLRVVLSYAGLEIHYGDGVTKETVGWEGSDGDVLCCFHHTL